MPIEENKAIVRRYFEMINQDDMAKADAVLADDVVLHDPASPEPVRGLRNFKQLLTLYHQVFPDAHWAIDEEIAEGNKVMVRWSGRATHQGTYLGVPATGRQVTYSGILIFRTANGKVAENWGYPDKFGLLQQLGAIPTDTKQS